MKCRSAHGDRGYHLLLATTTKRVVKGYDTDTILQIEWEYSIEIERKILSQERKTFIDMSVAISENLGKIVPRMVEP